MCRRQDVSVNPWPSVPVAGVVSYNVNGDPAQDSKDFNPERRSAMQVNVARNGVNLGVFELGTLKAMVAEGKLFATDHVYLTKEERWEIIDRVPELRAALFPAGSVPPPPPPSVAQVIPPPPPPIPTAHVPAAPAAQSIPAVPPSASMSVEADANEQLLAEKLGSNTERYLKKYRAHKGESVFVSWNWAAFLFGPFWTAYRSLWPAAIGLAVVILGCTYGYGEISLPRIVFNGLPLLAALVLGMIGDSLVISSILKKGRDGSAHQPGRQKFVGGAFGIVILLMIGGLGQLSTCWSCSDEKFAEYAMKRLIKGWDGVNDHIDWPNLQVNGQDVGMQYRAMPNPIEEKNFEFAFISSFSNEVKKWNFELHNYRMVGSQGPVRFVRAKANGKEFEIHVVQTEDGKKIQAFFPVEAAN